MTFTWLDLPFYLCILLLDIKKIFQVVEMARVDFFLLIILNVESLEGKSGPH